MVWRVSGRVGRVSGLAALNKQEESVLNFDHWLTEYGQTFVCVRPTSGE